MYSIKDLLLFIKVADLQSFSNTAKCLNVSQATISRQIKDLEENFGSELIKRDSRTFELTQAGRILYETIKQDVTQIDSIMSSLKDKIQSALNSSDEPSGNLLVVISPVIAHELIAAKLPLFLRQYPDVNLSVILDSKASIIEDGVDYAITPHIPTQLSYKVKALITLTYKLFCTKAYKEKYGVPQNLNEMHDHICVGQYQLYSNGSKNSHNMKTIIATNDNTGEEYIIDMPERLCVSNMTQNKKLIYSNEAICALNQLSAQELRKNEELVEVLPEFSFAKTKFYAIKHPYSNEAAVKVFSSFIDETIAQYIKK